MKIWLLTNDYPPLYGFGIGRYLENAAKMYTDAGHDVTIFVRDEYEDSVEIVSDKKRVIRYSEVQSSLPDNLNVFLKNSYKLAEVVIAQIMQGDSPDIIEVQDCMALGYYLLQRKKQGEKLLQNIPILVHAHGPRYEILRANKMLEHNLTDLQIGLYEKVVYGLADGVVAPSQYIAEKIKEFVPCPVEVIPLPFELSVKYQTATLVLDIDLLYIGRLEQRKGVIEFVAEVAKLWRQGHKLKLTLVGANTYLGELKEGMKEFLIANYYQEYKTGLLQIIEQVPTELVYILMQKARLVVLPSFYDNFPVSVLESMSLARPVLVSTSGGQRELVNSESGFLFTWGEDLALKIENVLSLSDDQLNQIGQRGRQRVQEVCNYQNNLIKRLELFKKLIQKISVPRPIEKIEHEEKLLSIIFTVKRPDQNTSKNIQTILSSTYQNIELIVVLYGKQSQKKIDLPTDKKLKIISSKLEDEIAARTSVLEQLKGAYVSFVSDQEYIANGYYEKCINVLKLNEKVSFVYSWVKYFNEQQQRTLALFDTDYPLNLLPEFFMVSNNAVYRRELYLKYGEPDPSLAPELAVFESWLRLFENGYNAVCLPEILTAKELATIDFNEQGLNYQDVLKFEKMIDKHKSFFEKHSVELFKLNFANI